MTIHLGTQLLGSSSGLPEDSGEQPSNVFLHGLAPSGVCLDRIRYRIRGGLLLHHFTLTCRYAPGGIFSVALSWRLPSPGVTRHFALWSPDFPLEQPLLAVRAVTTVTACAVPCSRALAKRRAQGLGRFRSPEGTHARDRGKVRRELLQVRLQFCLRPRFELAGPLARYPQAAPNFGE